MGVEHLSQISWDKQGAVIPQLVHPLATSRPCFPSGREAAWPCPCPEEWPVPFSHRPMDPVLKAIKEDDEEAVKAMIKAGRNLAEPNKEGWLPLHEAAYYGQLRCLKALHRGEAAALGAAGGGSWTQGQGSFLLKPQTTWLRGAGLGEERRLAPLPQQHPPPPLQSPQASQDKRDQFLEKKGGRAGF